MTTTPEGGYYKQERFTNNAIKKFLFTYGYIMAIVVVMLLYGVHEVKNTIYNVTSIKCSLDNFHSGDVMGYKGDQYRISEWNFTGDMIFAQFTQNN